MFFEEEEEDKQKLSAAELEYQSFMDDLREVTNTEAGKRVFWKILEYAGIHSSSFDKDLSQMCLNEGRREVGLWIEARLEEINPNLIYEIAKTKEKVNVRTNG